MNDSILKLTVLVIVAAVCGESTPGPAATFQDISPNTANGIADGSEAHSAGVTIGLAGNQAALYAMSMNAGVWKSTDGGAWLQLERSPEHAYSIAVDPNDAAHLAVGERDGDAFPVFNHSGVWESFDGGAMWTYALDPLTLRGCPSQAVPAVAFSAASTLFAATRCGIARKRPNALAFDPDPRPAGTGLVSALAASQTKVWARTPAGTLLVTVDDGDNWLPATSQPIPSGGANFTVGNGDDHSLAAFDDMALMSSFGGDNGAGNNFNQVTIYHVASDSWSLERINNSLNGTGFGGSIGKRFVKSFVLDRADLPSELGQRLRLFFGSGQEVFQASGLNADGTIKWDLVIASAVGGGPLHADQWDFLMAPDGRDMWLSHDGGVSENIDGAGWVTRIDGLHTHHVHSMVVLTPPSATAESPIAYSTQDNSAWFRDSAGTWRPTQCGLGDSNFAAGDVLNPARALVWRDLQAGLAALTTFGASNDVCTTLQNLPVSVSEGGKLLQFIQTLPGESPTFPLLDAVMLALPGSLGQPDPNAGPVLIRNMQYANNPKPPSGWSVEDSSPPAGTQGFWVSGGHAQPVYYLYSADADGLHLYRRSSPGSWQRLNVTGLLAGSTYGPAFVDPYDPDHLFVLTSTGVRVSTDGGSTFPEDPVLTSLITGAGEFPLTCCFGGGNGTALTMVLFNHARPTGSLAHMAFDPGMRHGVVAASPFTGVFHSTGDGSWRDLSINLPLPHTPVSAVGIGIGSATVYAAMEGRSIVAFTPAPGVVARCKDTISPTDPDVCSSASASVDNGSFDQDGDAITLSQSPSGPYSLGTTQVILKAADGNGDAAYCSANLTVIDQQPPRISCPAPVAECTSPRGTVVTFSDMVSDNCPGVADLGCVLASGSTFTLGSTPFTCTAADASQNRNSCSSAVVVQDTTPPTISAVAATPNVLWPANHKMVPVQVAVLASDICDPTPVCSVTAVASNEAALQTGSGHTPVDFQITGALSVDLRAERSGGGNGRIYTITVHCIDHSNNSTMATTTVQVRHDMGHMARSKFSSRSNPRRNGRGAKRFGPRHPVRQTLPSKANSRV